MTARELIDRLRELVEREDAADLPVIVEGCDCYEFAAGAEVEAGNQVTGEREPAIVITRITRG